MAGTDHRFVAREALRPALAGLRGYAAIEPPAQLAARYGVAAEDVLELHGNENAFGASPKALEALRGDFDLHRYPESSQSRLREAIGDYAGVDPSSVVPGAGSDELIDLVFRLYIDPGERILIASPTFGMYAFDARLHGAEVVDVPRGEDWRLDLDGVVVAAADAKVVILPSPNNPTGDLLPEGAVDRLLETGALLVVDEAYIEFAHAESLAQRAAEDPALIVLRTFSKWGGLAGLRVGYGVMTPEHAELFTLAKQPYDVGVAAERAVLATLEDVAVLDERACIIAGERDRVAEALREGGWIEPAPSEANFLLCRFLRGDGLTVRDALRRRGIFVRYFEAERLRDCLRISIGTAEENDRVIEALGEIGTELEAAQ